MKTIILLVASCSFLSCSSNSSTGPVSLASCNPGERPVVVNNNASEDIWLGMVSSSQTCTTNADCGAGSCVPGVTGLTKAGAGKICACSSSNQCNSAANCDVSNQKCFLKLPRIINPNQSQKKAFMPQGTSVALCFPSAKGLQTQWSGRLFARKGCDQNGQNCQSANCSTNQGACPNSACGPGFSSSNYSSDCPNNGTCAPQDGNCIVGTGGSPPATSAEFTLQNRAQAATNTDFYDITMIDGVNIAMSIQPDPKTLVLDASRPYQCTSPGATTQSGSLLPCNWKIVPKNSVLLRQPGLPVGITPNSCTKDSDCTRSGDICGLALNAGNGAKFGNVCGPLQGYWSASQICGAAPATTDASPIGSLNCQGNSNNQPVLDLFTCTATASASCYNTGGTPDATCCGCPTATGNNSGWPSLDSAQASIQCAFNNPNWVTAVQPWLEFFKTACPTAYTFPFDDPTSTFNCASNGNPDETPGYTVTFSDLM